MPRCINAWLENVSKLATIEIGAGKEVPTIRKLGVRQEGVIIRINPQHYYLPPGKGVSLAMGGLEGLRLIEAQMIE